MWPFGEWSLHPSWHLIFSEKFKQTKIEDLATCPEFWNSWTTKVLSKSKVRIRVFYLEGTLLISNSKNFLFYSTFDLTQPRGPKSLSKSQKMGPFPGLLNKSWKFGGLAYNKTWSSPRNINLWFYSVIWFEAALSPYGLIKFPENESLSMFTK